MKKKLKLNTNVKAAHQFSARNKKQLMESNKCGCFYCKEIFEPSEIIEWLN